MRVKLIHFVCSENRRRRACRVGEKEEIDRQKKDLQKRLRNGQTDAVISQIVRTALTTTWQNDEQITFLHYSSFSQFHASYSNPLAVVHRSDRDHHFAQRHTDLSHKQTEKEDEFGPD